MALECHIVTFEEAAVAKALTGSMSSWTHNPSLFSLDVARNDGISIIGLGHVSNRSGGAQKEGLGASSHSWCILVCVTLLSGCPSQREASEAVSTYIDPLWSPSCVPASCMQYI